MADSGKGAKKVSRFQRYFDQAIQNTNISWCVPYCIDFKKLHQLIRNIRDNLDESEQEFDFALEQQIHRCNDFFQQMISYVVGCVKQIREEQERKGKLGPFTTPLNRGVDARSSRLADVLPTFFTRCDRVEKLESAIIQIEQFAIVNCLVLSRVIVKHDKYSSHALRTQLLWKMERRGFCEFAKLEPLILLLSNMHRERLEQDKATAPAATPAPAAAAPETKQDIKTKVRHEDARLWHLLSACFCIWCVISCNAASVGNVHKALFFAPVWH